MASSDDQSGNGQDGSLKRGKPLPRLSFVLCAHLPYVLAHDQWPHGLNWLFEAAAETYIPLLNVFNRLVAEGISPRVTIGLSPVLCEMLADISFALDFREYLQARIDSSGRNTREFAAQGQADFRDLAIFWQDWYTNIARDFDYKYDHDIVGGFRKLQDEGHLEIMTGAASHAYFPLFGDDAAVRAQVSVGVESYKRHFGREPRGFWLAGPTFQTLPPDAPPHGGDGAPGCGPGRIAQILLENGIEYCAFDGPSSLPDSGAARRQPFDLAGDAPGGATLTVLPGDSVAQTLVCDRQNGYCCHGDYLDTGKRHYPGGHRLWRLVSAESNPTQKQPYEPVRLAEIATTQAGEFRDAIAAGLPPGTFGDAPASYCTFDARLFGQWWFEGPQWLYRVLKKLAHASQVEAATAGASLRDRATAGPATAMPAAAPSPDGAQPSNAWLAPGAAWTWTEIHGCQNAMSALAELSGASGNPKLHEIVRQCARELLLMESSQWQSMIASIEFQSYAELRIAEHVNCFQRLAELAHTVAEGGLLTEGEREYIRAAIERDRCFSHLPIDHWSPTRTIQKPFGQD